MNTSPAGIKFIADNEGFCSHAQGDYGHLVIGHGHDLLPGESYPDGITLDQAGGLLQQDIAKVDAAMNAQHLALDFNQNQFDAVADFTFECGGGALIQLLAHGVDQIPAQLPRWVRAGGQVLPDMVARRKADVELFNTPV
jgi:lysozyme